MLKPLLLAATCLSALVTQAQQLLYPATYHVKILALYRRLPGSTTNQLVKRWNVNLLLVTGQDGVRIYRTVGNEYYRQKAGPPVYQLRQVEYGKRYNEDEGATEIYGAAYRGDINPPTEWVRDPTEVAVAWTSAVTGGSTLKVLWIMDERAGRQGTSVTQKGLYRLTFFCTPAAN